MTSNDHQIEVQEKHGNENAQGNGANDHDNQGKTKTVNITVDGNPKTLSKDKYRVSELKLLVGVPADYELDEVVHGEFKPLEDDKEINIKNGDVFVSHVKEGASS